MHKDFRERIRTTSLVNKTLQLALDANAERRVSGRVAALASLPHWRERRQQAHAVHADVIEHLTCISIPSSASLPAARDPRCRVARIQDTAPTCRRAGAAHHHFIPVSRSDHGPLADCRYRDVAHDRHARST